MPFDLHASYKQTFTSGAVTTIAAGTATAGHILALRNSNASKTVRLRSLEVEFILTTAFGAAQEVGFDVLVARSYSAAHTGGTTLTISGNDGKKQAGYGATILAGSVASAAALTAGTHTFDNNAIARSSVWCGAVGASLSRYYDFTAAQPYGIYLAQNEGIVGRNTILMGASGIGKWHFTVEWDEGVLS